MKHGIPILDLNLENHLVNQVTIHYLRELNLDQHPVGKAQNAAWGQMKTAQKKKKRTERKVAQHFRQIIAQCRLLMVPSPQLLLPIHSLGDPPQSREYREYCRILADRQPREGPRLTFHDRFQQPVLQARISLTLEDLRCPMVPLHPERVPNLGDAHPPTHGPAAVVALIDQGTFILTKRR